MANLLEEREYYKPFDYGWAFEAYKKQQQMHWMPEEVTMADDIKDYNKNYTEYRNFLKSKVNEKTPNDQPPKEKKVKERSDKDRQKLTYMERKEFNRLEKEIEKHEVRKSEIMELFNDSSLSGEEIQKLSIELGELNHAIEDKEMRWLELSEYA